MYFNRAIAKIIDKLDEAQTSEDKKLMSALKSEIENIDSALKEIIEIDKKENFLENNIAILNGDTIHEDAVLEE